MKSIVHKVPEFWQALVKAHAVSAFWQMTPVYSSVDADARVKLRI